MMFILGGRFNIKGKAKVVRAHDIFVRKLKDWGSMQHWVHKLQLEVLPQDSNDSVSFNSTSNIVEEISRRYVSFNDKECSALRQELLKIESKKAGRVRLTEFYKKGLSGVFKFNEKV